MNKQDDSQQSNGPDQHPLLKIRIVRDIVIPLNAYAYGGRIESVYKLAPWGLWQEKYRTRIVASIILAGVLHYFSEKCTSSACVSSDLIVSIFPNLLGFLIGVYALIFTLPELIKSLGGSGKRTKLVNSDMAMPLTCMAISIFVSVISKGLGNPSALACLCWFFLIYVLLLLFEVIVLIYTAASRVALINDVNPKESNKENKAP